MRESAGRLEDLFMDITFSEEREFQSAREVLRSCQAEIEDTLTAIAFAEAGDLETAARRINKQGGAAMPCFAKNPEKRFTRICTGRA